MDNSESRERDVLALLEDWPWESGSTLIGGYAMAAYGAARYSEDIDFTIPGEARTEIVGWLGARGFESRRLGPVEGLPSAHVLRFERDTVTIDLLIDFVRDRQAQVEIPESWIAARPNRVRLTLLSGRTGKPVVAARPEALWALKLQAGRDQDLTDLFAISGEPVDSEQVRDLFHSLMVPTLSKKLQKVLAGLTVRKIYDDARSRLFLKDEPNVRLRWERFRSKASRMIPEDVISSDRAP